MSPQFAKEPLKEIPRDQQQRGNGIFEKSICASKKLNAAGNGITLPLNLVYNPLGAKLLGPQTELDAGYKKRFTQEFGLYSTSFTF
jgi:hypothetical protein